MVNKEIYEFFEICLLFSDYIVFWLSLKTCVVSYVDKVVQICSGQLESLPTHLLYEVTYRSNISFNSFF
jgi:hypothetical protein